MGDTPLVSIAMITYNHRHYVGQALESVVSQRRSFPIEIVISDDCSPDGTAEVICKYESANPGLIRRLDPPQNVGMNRNMNRVWQACGGKYIALLEGDDWWHDAEKLSIQVEFMEAHPECVIAGHTTRHFPPDGAPPVDRPMGWPELSNIDLLIKGCCLPTSSVMCRRGVVPGVPNWAMELGMADWPLNLLHAAAGKVGFINQSLSSYRMHAGGVWSPLKKSERLNRMLKASRVMQQNFPKEFWGKFEAAIGHLHFLLFQAYRDSGDYRAARSHLLKSCYHKFRGRDLYASMIYKVPARMLFPGIGAEVTTAMNEMPE